MPPFSQVPDDSGVVWPQRAWSGGNVSWQPGEVPRLSAETDLLLTFGFQCNLSCTFCLAADAMGGFEGVRPETLRSWLKRPELFRGVQRIVLSGGETTLDPQLLEFASLARQVPGVQHVRVQTNATRLSNRGFLRSLVEAGIDEFFVSCHGDDEASTAELTRTPGAFKAILAGMQAVTEQPGATLYTNTCIVQQNFALLPRIVEVVARFQPAQASFWMLFLRRADLPGVHQAMARNVDVQPHLLRALDRADELGLPAIVKWFPRCLLDRHHAKHDDSQPTTLVEPEFWPAVPRYACLYHHECVWGPARLKDGDACNGLPYPYIHRFGWEEDLLWPPPPELAGVPDFRPQRSDAQTAELTGVLRQAVEALAARLELPDAVAAAGLTLGRALQAGRSARFLIELGDRSTWLEMAPPDEAGPSWHRSASFTLRHARSDGALGEAMGRMLAHWRQRLAATDPGGLRLPWWG